VSEFLTGPPSSPEGPFEWGPQGPAFEMPASDGLFSDPELQTGPGSEVPSPVPPKRMAKRSLFMLLGAVGLVGVTVIGASALGGADKRALTGSVALFDVDGLGSAANCAGSGGYGDIEQGMQVVVKNGDGKILATSELGRGEGETAREVLNEGGSSSYDSSYSSSFDSLVVRCTFPFEVKVPSGETFYSVTLGSSGRRGTLTYSKADLDKEDWKVSITIGS
jgi:hypothetical protein